MKKHIVAVALLLLITPLFSQNDSVISYTKRYLAEIHNTNLSKYTGSLVIFNLANCGKGTICGSALEKFVGHYAAISDLNKLVLLLGNDSVIESKLAKAQNITVIHGTYDQARIYGLGLALHHLFLVNNGTFTFSTVPTIKNQKKILHTLKKFSR